jgi:hypothetical protein
MTLSLAGAPVAPAQGTGRNCIYLRDEPRARPGKQAAAARPAAQRARISWAAEEEAEEEAGQADPIGRWRRPPAPAASEQLYLY